MDVPNTLWRATLQKSHNPLHRASKLCMTDYTALPRHLFPSIFRCLLHVLFFSPLSLLRNHEHETTDTHIPAYIVGDAGETRLLISVKTYQKRENRGNKSEGRNEIHKDSLRLRIQGGLYLSDMHDWVRVNAWEVLAPLHGSGLESYRLHSSVFGTTLIRAFGWRARSSHGECGVYFSLKILGF